MWNNGMGYGMGWGMWLVAGLGLLGFWVVVALLVRLLLSGRPDPSSSRPDPLRMLDERLARGEVSVEEYQQRRRLLIDGH